MKRRSFIKMASGVAGACALGHASTQAETETTVEGMPHRVLGKTGEKVSVIGFPGLALVHYDQAEGDQGIRRAFDQGLNYFDVAPAYGKGEAEKKMGVGLQQLKRDEYFLACKTQRRDAKGAREELERSLKRLKTDYFDLYQLHVLRQTEESQQTLEADGALETILKAKEEGKIKHIGFSAHTTRSALKVMKGFQFDTVMFPINYVEYYRMGFGREILEEAAKQEAAVLAIKPMSMGGWPKGMERTRRWWYRSTEEQPDVDLAFRFALSQPGVVSGIPPSFLDLLDKAIVAAKHYRPLDDADVLKLRNLAFNSTSIFRRDELQLAGTAPSYEPFYPHQLPGIRISRPA